MMNDRRSWQEPMTPQEYARRMAIYADLIADLTRTEETERANAYRQVRAEFEGDNWRENGFAYRNPDLT